MNDVLVPQLDLDPNVDGPFLLGHASVAAELELFNNNPNYTKTNIKKVTSKAYLALLSENDSDLNETIDALKTGSIPGGDILWDILKEQLAIALQEIVADLIPGGTIITIGPQLLENIRSGNWLDAMYNAVDIALNEADAFIPAAKVASVAFAIVDKYSLIKNIYKPLKQAKSLGQNFVLKLYDTLRNRFGVSEIRNKMRWLGSGVGAKLYGVSSSDFFDDLKNSFGAGNSVFLGQKGYPVFKIGEISQADLGIYMELYPDSDSGFNWTIAFSTGPLNATGPAELNPKFKIRFDF